MLNSMTAFGQSRLSRSWGQLVIEIWSVNRRFLEINAHLPRELIRFDPEIKKWISSAVGRGQVNVRVTAEFTSGSPVVIQPNLSLAKQLQEVSKTLSHELGIEDLTEQLLIQSPDLIERKEVLDDEDQWKEDLHTAVDEALKPFLKMKQVEGAVLQKDIVERLTKCIPLIDAIEKQAPQATTRYRDRLAKSIELCRSDEVESEDKILREIAIYAEKIDITEEIVRFRSHLTQFCHHLDTQDKAVGKTLEFLLQELLREVNTIGAKSSDVDVTRQVVEIKSELERVREQIQNIE